MKNILLTVVLAFFSFYFINAQGFYSSDTLKYPQQLLVLEKALFPNNNSLVSLELIEKCSTETKNVLLVQRKNRPDPQAIIPLIENVFYLADTSLVDILTNIYNKQIELFQNEWGWAITSNTRCEDLLKELQVIEAFERTIYGLKMRRKYINDDDYFKLIMLYNKAQTITILYPNIKFAVQPKDYVMEAWGAKTVEEIDNLTIAEFYELKEVWSEKRISAYTKLIDTKYNAFGGIDLSWNIFSPFLKSIKEPIIKLYNQYNHSPKDKSMEYFLHENFFRIQLKPADYLLIGLNK